MRIASSVCIAAALILALAPSIGSGQDRKIHVNFGGGPTFLGGDLGEHSGSDVVVVYHVAFDKQKLVWRGMGVKEVDTQAKADKRDKNITSAVKKILKDFPPKKKG